MLSKTMNNLDVSIINVLKSTYPDIFHQYFNDIGIIPNPNLNTRNKAKVVFQKYSSENFDSFVQRYRNFVWNPKISTYLNYSAPIIPYQSFEKTKETFKAINFIKEKRKQKNYYLLEFLSDDGVQENLINLNRNKFSEEFLEKNMLECIKALNNIYKYEILLKM